MKTAIFWMLLTISDGAYNTGTIDQIGPNFQSQAACEQVIKHIEKKFNGGGYYLACIRVGGASE